jgi:osmotically-inducible protein OsmY
MRKLLLTMKNSFRTLAALIALGGGVVISTNGCSSMTGGKSAGEVIDDATITTKVKAAMVKDPLVKALDVNVDTNRGNVMLKGMVDTAEQKSRAEQIARGTQGVVGVQNNLTLKGQPTP